MTYNQTNKKLFKNVPIGSFWNGIYAFSLLRKQQNIKNKLSTPYLVPASMLPMILFFLKNHTATQCNQCIDIVGVDTLSNTTKFFNTKYRFVVNYLLRSTLFETHWVIQTQLKISQYLPSITSIYGSARWLEREVWDLFGIYFQNHSDLRRILTDYGFKSHPLRKDFPLTGFEEIYYNDSSKQILYVPVILMQEYRTFTLDSTWLHTVNK